MAFSPAFMDELVARNPNRFSTNGFGDYQGEVWGKTDEEYVYIIKSVFDREMLSAGFNSTAFLSWAKRKGYLLTDNNRKTKRSRIAGNVANCVCIFYKKYNEIDTIEEIDDDFDF